jgi:3'(2'), 5'-bisphosphate nucleotidase
MIMSQYIFQQEILHFLKREVKAAGKILLDQYNSPSGIQEKSDGTPVSDADKASSKYLHEKIFQAFPNAGIFDEEHSEDKTGLEKEYCFVIDPLDGTKDYLRKGNTFSIFVGVLHYNIPKIAVTYRPMIDELAYAIKGEGAYLTDQIGTRKLQVRQESTLQILITSSRPTEELDNLLNKISPTQIAKLSSSTKIIEIAKGNADAFICAPGTQMHMWDLCAPSLILEEAGGTIADITGKPFTYTKSDVENSHGVIASSWEAYKLISKKLKS